MSFGSLHALPVKLMPSGEGFASNPGGNGGDAMFGTRANGTITVGYPGLAATAAPVDPTKTHRIEAVALHRGIDALGAGQPYVGRAVREIANTIALEIDLVGDVELRLTIFDRTFGAVRKVPLAQLRQRFHRRADGPSETSHRLKSRFIPYLKTIEQSASLPLAPA